MRSKISVSIFTILCLAGNLCVIPAHAEESFSVIRCGWSGLLLGTTVGAAVGGIQAAEEHDRLDSNGETKRVVNGALYGLIGGTVLGLGLGLYDLSQGESGVAQKSLHNAWLGGGIGLIVGAAIGGINYAKTDNATDLGNGIAWGYIGGAFAGLVFGFIDGEKFASNTSSTPAFRFALIPDSRGHAAPYLSFQHTY
jgi:hypothetical protein